MAINPFLRLVAGQPHLLGAHVEAYAALIRDEASKLSTSLAVRIGLYIGAAVFALLGLVLTGVALLIRASVDPIDYPAGWALVVVPLTPWALAAVMVLVARAKAGVKPFAAVREQFAADRAMLREFNP